MPHPLNLYGLSHAQRAALYGTIESLGLEVADCFSGAPCIQFMAAPTEDGIGYNAATNTCLRALMAICGSDNWDAYKEPAGPGIAFRDGWRRRISIPIMREPFPVLSLYGAGL